MHFTPEYSRIYGSTFLGTTGVCVFLSFSDVHIVSSALTQNKVASRLESSECGWKPRYSGKIQLLDLFLQNNVP